MTRERTYAPELAVNAELLTEILVRFVREEIQKIGVSKAVVGVSGGVDSAVSCFLAAEALGPKNVWAVLMPYETSHPDSVNHAQLVVKATGVCSEEVPITAMVDGYFTRYPDAGKARRGNAMARQRMIVLYDFSMAYDGLVVGTSNKTEALLGYSTLWGDMACAVNPLGDLYKSQVWQLAEHLGVPAPIVDKDPSADLWEGQTDEDELGFTYAEADRILFYMVDRRYTMSELAALGYAPATIERIFTRMQRSQYKRRMPIIAKVSHRTVDRDFRYPRDWGV